MRNVKGFIVPVNNKKEAYKRANNRCEECKGNKNLQIHHIIPKVKGINNDLTNLKILCRDCHGKVDKTKHIKPGDRKMAYFRVYFNDKDFEFLKYLKGEATWVSFIMDMAEGYSQIKKRGDLQ